MARCTSPVGYVSLADFSGGMNNKIGIWLTNVNYSVDSFCPPPCSLCLFSDPNYSQIFYQNVVSDSLNWVEIQGSFISDSSYQYLVIGNFFINDSTTNISISSSVNAGTSYYFFDDLYLGKDSVLNLDHSNVSTSIRIFPNPTYCSVSIEFDNSEKVNDVELSIWDILGNQKDHAYFNTSKISLWLYGYKPGVYFINIISKQKNEYFKLIIIN